MWISGELTTNQECKLKANTTKHRTNSTSLGSYTDTESDGLEGSTTGANIETGQFVVDNHYFYLLYIKIFENYLTLTNLITIPSCTLEFPTYL